MPIYQYQKVSDEFTTYTIQLNQDQTNQELATIDGVTYHYVEGELPEQFEQITVTEVSLTDELRSQLKKHSRVFSLIDEGVVQRIRSRFSVEDEFKMLRTGSGAEYDEYADWVSQCRAWGQSERQRFGL